MYLLLLLCLFGTTVEQSQSEATDLSVTTEAGGSVTTKADLEGGQPEGDRLPANKTTQPEGGIQPEKTRAILPLPRVEPGAAGSSAIETSQNEDGPGDPVAETNTPGDVMFTASPLLQSTPIPERFPIVEQIPPQQPPPVQTIGVEGGQGIPLVDGPVTQRPLPIETGPLTVTQLPVVIVNQSQIPPPAPAVFPWPIPFPEPFPFPTIPPFNLGRFLQGAAGAVPTSSFQLPPFDPNDFLRNIPTLPPFPTLGPWPTLPPWESVYNGIPTLSPFPTLGPLPSWNQLFPTASQQCIPRLLTFAQQDPTFGEQLNNFTTSGDVVGAIQAGVEQAKSLCSADQVSRLTDFLNSHRGTWELMTTYGQTLTLDERQRVKTLILNNDPLGLTLFGMTKGLENIFNPTVSQQISQISSQLSLMQLQLFFSPI